MIESFNIDDNQRALIDPDNAFWAIVRRNAGGGLPSNFYSSVKDKLDKQLKDFRFSRELTAVYIDPTDRCNANCPYCYVPEATRKYGRSMTDRELTFILNRVDRYFKARKRKPVIVFHASEPLLVKDIVFKAIRNFRKQFKFGIQTNAVLLEKPDAEFLKNEHVGIGISLDSSSIIVNNKSRRFWQGGGNFENAVRAIEWFGGYNGLNVITTMTKFNIKGLPDMVRFLHKKKVPCVLCNPVRLTQKSSRKVKPDEGLMTRYFIKAVDTAIELSKKSNHRIIIGNFSNTILGIVAPTARRLMCDISPCGGGRCFFTITAKGEMIPCGEFIGLSGFSGGNIFKDSVSKAMSSGPFKRIRARFVERISECDVCIFRNICGAPCPAELYSLGNMYQKSVFCEFYKQIIRHAFKVIAKREEKYCFRQNGLGNLEYEYCL